MIRFVIFDIFGFGKMYGSYVFQHSTNKLVKKYNILSRALFLISRKKKTDGFEESQVPFCKSPKHGVLNHGSLSELLW